MNQTKAFAAILKQVAHEMNLDVFNPDDHQHIYAELPATETWEELCALRVSAEKRIQALQDEYHERRRLFIAAMRRPEMRLVRAALRDMRWDKNVDWRDITSMEILPESEWSTTWVLLTDKYEIICLWSEHLRLDFHVWRLHDAADPACPCEYCQRGREMAVSRAEVESGVA